MGDSAPDADLPLLPSDLRYAQQQILNSLAAGWVSPILPRSCWMGVPDLASILLDGCPRSCLPDLAYLA